MAKGKAYVIASEEGAQWASEDFDLKAVGQEVELELDADQERALLAAGWLELKGGKK